MNKDSIHLPNLTVVTMETLKYAAAVAGDNTYFKTDSSNNETLDSMVVIDNRLIEFQVTLQKSHTLKKGDRKNEDGHERFRPSSS